MTNSFFQVLRRASSRLALAACTLTAIIGGRAVQAQQAPDFAYHWGIFTNPVDLKFGSKVDWASRIDFQGAPIVKDFITLYEHEFVLDARSQGIALMYTNRDYWTTVRSRLRTIIDREAAMTPGVRHICLDIEFLDTKWGNRTGGPGIYPNSGHGATQFDAWFTYMRNHRPNEIQGLSSTDLEAVLARTYEAAVREFFLGCLREARAVRNDVKWGFYGYPNRRYAEYLQPAPSKWTLINDDLRWMFDAVDALYPALYNQILAVPDGKPDRVRGYEWEITFLSNIIRANINEFKRCAQGKPVICFAGTRYHCPIDPNFAYNFLQPMDLYIALTLPREAGVNGLIIWDMIENQTNYEAHQQFMSASVNPLVRQAFAVALPTEDLALPPTGEIKTGDPVGTASTEPKISTDVVDSTPTTVTPTVVSSASTSTSTSTSSSASTTTSTSTSEPKPVTVATTSTTSATKTVTLATGSAKVVVKASARASASIAKAVSRFKAKTIAAKKPVTNTKVAGTPTE